MEKEQLSAQKPRVPVFEIKIKAHVTGEDLGYFMLDEKAIYKSNINQVNYNH